MSDKVLAGRAAVVTGGSRGIGRAVVERLAADGADVVFGYAHDDAAAAEVVRAVAANAAAGANRATGAGRVYAVRADLGTPEGPEQLMAAAEEELGGLDILVNNAARAVTRAPLAETDPADFDSTMAVNARAVFLTLRYAARRMRDGGRIVNISSLNTRRPMPGLAAYLAGKGALEQLTEAAAVELGPRGITANTVSPGPTETEMLRSVNPPHALETVAGLTPLRRLGQPADVADVVAFLVGPDARWVSGQNLGATGGLR
ncbi:SDR family oxidoreductase [Kitasatospora sp. cg17-2]